MNVIGRRMTVNGRTLSAKRMAAQRTLLCVRVCGPRGLRGALFDAKTLGLVMTAGPPAEVSDLKSALFFVAL